jgi:hypothetical protein
VAVPSPDEVGSRSRSPIITPEEIEVFRQDADLRRKLLKSFQVILNFYGFQLAPDKAITADAEFGKKAGR